MTSDRDNVRITKSVALYIMREARNLFRYGVGQDIDGSDVSSVLGEMDNIPSDSETYRWANACVSFLRYVAHIIANQVNDELGLEDITDPFDTTSDEGSI